MKNKEKGDTSAFPRSQLVNSLNTKSPIGGLTLSRILSQAEGNLGRENRVEEAEGREHCSLEGKSPAEGGASKPIAEEALLSCLGLDSCLSSSPLFYFLPNSMARAVPLSQNVKKIN